MKLKKNPKKGGIFLTSKSNENLYIGVIDHEKWIGDHKKWLKAFFQSRKWRKPRKIHLWGKKIWPQNRVFWGRLPLVRSFYYEKSNIGFFVLSAFHQETMLAIRYRLYRIANCFKFDSNSKGSFVNHGFHFKCEPSLPLFKIYGHLTIVRLKLVKNKG